MNQKMNVNIATIKNIFCKKRIIANDDVFCGSILWDQVMIAKRVPALLTGSTHDTVVNVPILICHSCGTILPDHEILIKEMSPELKKEELKKLIVV